MQRMANGRVYQSVCYLWHSRENGKLIPQEQVISKMSGTSDVSIVEQEKIQLMGCRAIRRIQLNLKSSYQARIQI